jgi:hypothetical protein
MSGIETADMRPPHTLDQGQLTTDSESVEDLPSHWHLALQVSASYMVTIIYRNVSSVHDDPASDGFLKP